MSAEDTTPIPTGNPLPTPPPSPLDDQNFELNPASTPTIPDFFAGFQPKYPEYEILTPQTLIPCTIRSLSVEGEEGLKGSMITRRQTPELINKAIFDALVTHPFKDYEHFLECVTMRDRDALLYGLYHVTYKDIHNYEMTCPKCSKGYSIKVELGNIFSMDAWPGESNEVLGQRYQVTLESVDNTIAVVKQPTLADEKLMLSDMLFQSDKHIDLGVEMLIVDKFVHDPKGRTPMIIENRTDIYKAYTKMLPIDRKSINNIYIEKFGKYGVDLKLTSRCTHCDHESESDLDLLTQFFRSLYE
jgi:hypothetical protein